MERFFLKKKYFRELARLIRYVVSENIFLFKSAQFISLT